MPLATLAPNPCPAPAIDHCSLLSHILLERKLNPVFQPIVSLAGGTLYGYEGLIRGPSDSSLHAAPALFQAAHQCGLLLEMEQVCRQTTLEHFAARATKSNQLFLNVSPECLIQPQFRRDETLELLSSCGLSPDHIVIEITENQCHLDFGLLREAVHHFRALGFRIALDDLGEGSSSLRLWSELKPDFVKIDKHFIQGIHTDPLKQQFVRSIRDLAVGVGCKTIAEGVETVAELQLVRSLGIDFAQGYLLGRPHPQPRLILPADIASLLTHRQATGAQPRRRSHAGELLQQVAPVTPDTSNETVFQMFSNDPELFAIPVTAKDVPIGLLRRQHVLETFARRYSRELHGKKSCTQLMDRTPIIVDRQVDLQAVSELVVAAGRKHLTDGFIITAGGCYAGMGNGIDLMRAITEIQICAARYANPLTLLPGNVPINEQIESLLAARMPFFACYVDLNHFKPFNDIYGYRNGDEMIQLLGHLLVEMTEPELDFVGHIGGDDFMLLTQSHDTVERCEALVARFGTAIRPHFNDEHLAAGGYDSIDRRGQKVFHPLPSLAIGIVHAAPGQHSSHHEIAAAATEAKRQAKKRPAGSVFVERRGTAAHSLPH